MRDAWIEARCTLFSGPDGPRWPWVALAAALAEWLEEGRCERWYFTRKPPGLRLRCFARDPVGAMQPALVAWLDQAESAGWIRGYRFAVYEPEVFRFGGPHGMELAHLQFDADSRAALRYQLWDASARLPAPLWTLAALQALIGRAVDDGAEAWDVWKRLEHAVASAGARAPQSSLDPALVRAALRGGPALRALTDDHGAALLDAVDHGAERCAGALLAACAANALTIGPRAWLAEAALFHCNRIGHGPDELAALIAAALACFEERA